MVDKVLHARAPVSQPAR